MPYRFLSAEQGWRTQWEAMGAGNLTTFISPQPWVTFDWLPFFYGGLAMVWWILCHKPDNEQRRKLAIIFALLGIALVAVSLLAWTKHWSFALWPTDGTIGPFRSRNQMATLLSVLSILLVSLIHSDWRHGRARSIFWIFALCGTLVAIVLNYSRAGILLFGFGVILYGALFAFYRKRTAAFAISVTVLLVFTAFFFVGGGKTLNRFLGPGTRSFDLMGDFRFLVHKDACSMIRDNFLFGTGLGNFDAVFPLYRSAVWDFRTWHPESDWLWLASDLGVPAMLAALAIAILIIVRLLRGKAPQISTVRIAGMVGCAQFLLHSYFDISAHETGTFLVLCFFLFLCWPGPGTSLRKRWPANVILLFLCGMSLLWISEWVQPKWRMGGYQNTTLMRQVAALRAQEKFTEAQVSLDQAKIQTPLDYKVHYISGRNILAARGNPDSARRELELASRMEPFSPVPEEDAARDWLRHDPEQASQPFIRALERSTPRQLRIGRYELYLTESQPYPPVFATLLQYGWNDTDLMIVRLKFIPQSDVILEVKIFMDRYRNNLDSLTSPRFFQTVESRSGVEGLEMIKELPGAYIALAKAYAKIGEFQKASRLVISHQTLNFGKSEGNKEVLYEEWKKDPANFIRGVSLLPFLSIPQDSPIIEELIGKFGKRKDAPNALYLLAARAAAENGDWDGSWRYLEIYLNRKR
ncbi:MAG: O-antigen ligase family protein [Chthoniobacterales bacterium]